MCEPWYKIMKEEKKEMSKYRNKKRRLNEIVQLKQNIYLQNAKKKKNQVDNDFFLSLSHVQGCIFIWDSEATSWLKINANLTFPDFI